MMAYTFRYQNELRNAADYFRDIKETAINEDALEMAEALIAKKTAKFDLSKFEDGYENAVQGTRRSQGQEPADPAGRAAKPQPGKVINLMDALRKSIGRRQKRLAARAGKKPPVSEKEPAAKGIGLVKEAAKPPAKSAPKRKTA